MKRVSIIVTGKVQGVYFRASAKEIADQLSIRGFAQNLPNGNVHIETEGEEQSLERFVAWCHTGSLHAHVTNVEVFEGDIKNFDRFEIRR